MNSSQESPRNWLNQGQIGRKAAYPKNSVPILTGGGDAGGGVGKGGYTC